MDTTLNSTEDSCHCRCCYKTIELEQQNSLFEYIDEMELYKMINTLTSLLIFRNDGFSQKICLECKTNVLMAYRFRQMCLSTDESVRLNRKPSIMNNEHDYSLYIDEYDMDLSEYLIPETKEPHQDILLQVQETLPKESTVLDDTQNFDAPISKKPRRRYACPICSRLWITPSKLERHMSVHRKVEKTVEEKPKFPEVQCPICFDPLDSPSNLKVHMKMHQRVVEAPLATKEGKKYKCSVCGSYFPTPAKLQNHMKSQHMRKVSILSNGKGPKVPEKMMTPQELGRNRKNLCSVCGKSFPHPSKLLRHMSIHSESKKDSANAKRVEERRHECNLCGKRFVTPSKLMRHQLSAVHRDVNLTMKSGDGIETPPVLEISAVTSILGD